MRFGIREVADLTLRSKQEVQIGSQTFHVGQPVLYISTATTSSLEQAATTVYAQGGRGNPRLIAWEGDKTLTLTFTDALLSPIGLSVLSGADLFHGKTSGISNVHVHINGMVPIGADGVIDISDQLAEYGVGPDGKFIAKFCEEDAPIFIGEVEEDGSSITGKQILGDVTATETKGSTKLTVAGYSAGAANVMLDYYVDLPAEQVWEADIRPDTFAGYYYVEADILVKDQATGKDMPGVITIPNAKMQSNFTITMASTGDPSTFDFTMDAFPGYTYFDKTKKVLAVIQIIDSTIAGADRGKPVMPHTELREHEDIFENANNGTDDRSDDVAVAIESVTLPTDWTKATDILRKNQKAATVTKEGTVITVTTKPDEMEAWTSTDASYADAAHKWVVLDIATGGDDITKYTYNGRAFTEADVAEANDVDLAAGHFDYWLATDDEKNITFTLGKDGESTKYTIKIVHAA